MNKIERNIKKWNTLREKGFCQMQDGNRVESKGDRFCSSCLQQLLGKKKLQEALVVFGD